MKKILWIGDSISLYYSPFLSGYIKDAAELHNKEGVREAFADLDRPVGGNGGDSSMILEYLRRRLEEGTLNYDLFVFNCGLHDIKRLNDGACVISETAYRDNLQKILDLMSERGIPAVFITTTQVPDEKHNARKQLGFTRYDRDVQKYNETARSVMRENAIPVIDLGGFTRSLDGEVFMDHVHFTQEVRRLQAAFLAGSLREWLTRT